MNKAVKLFGEYIYKKAPAAPKKTLGTLSFIYNLSGLACKHFPSKKLLPARQYMQWAAADSTVKSLKNPQSSVLVSLFTPCEIIHAMGLNTMFPEALACYLAAAGSEKIFIEKAEESGAPQTLCSYHKAMLGMVETEVLPKPACIVNTTFACDANQVSFRSVAERYEAPRFVIDVPRSDSEENINYVANQMRELVRFLEENTGKSFDEKRFFEAIERSKRTVENYRRIFELRRTRCLSDEMTSEMLSVFALHVMLGTPEAEKYTADFIKELEAQPEARRGVRLVWVHTLPYWQDALRDIVNFTDRCEIAACDFTFDCLTDTNEPDPYRFMAKRVIQNTLNGDGMKRIKAAAEYAEKLDADGIIWYCHWGCKQTAGSANLAKEYLEKRGFPTLILDGDGCDSGNVNDGQTVTRTEAFLELLEGRK